MDKELANSITAKLHALCMRAIEAKASATGSARLTDTDPVPMTVADLDWLDSAVQDMNLGIAR